MFIVLRVLGRPYGLLVPVTASLLSVLTGVIHLGSGGNAVSDCSTGCRIRWVASLDYCSRREACEK